MSDIQSKRKSVKSLRIQNYIVCTLSIILAMFSIASWGSAKPKLSYGSVGLAWVLVAANKAIENKITLIEDEIEKNCES